MKRRLVLAVAASCSFLFACDPHERGERNPAQGFQVGGANGTLEDPETDPTVMIDGSGGGGGPHQEVHPGDRVTVSIPFDAPNANVTGAGVRFGDSGPIQVIPIPGASGQTSGTLQFTFEIPLDICDNLSQICHDVKCYEFAVTSIGKVSAADINALALVCGNCDEPSCQDLLDSCEVGDCEITGCPQGEVCIDHVCQEQTEQNSCALRNPSCCPGQDNSCTAPGAVCFCDAFCAEAGDCCPDACATCGFCG
jgi:hypothetical protein